MLKNCVFSGMIGLLDESANLNLSLNVIYENGVFLAVFYYQLVVECIIVLFFWNINCWSVV